MTKSEIVNKLMYDYGDMSKDEVVHLCGGLDRKLVRWLGVHHPDNRTRKLFFRLTNIEIGTGTVVNINFLVSDDYERLLKIGDRVAIAPNVTVICVSYPNNSRLTEMEFVKQKLIRSEPITICDDVWVGTNVVLLPGVTVGAMSIIGAGSVVTEDVPPYSVVAGAPAKVIRTLAP